MAASNPKIKLIIGLGNPDKKYQNTYHNVGQLFIEYLGRPASSVQRPALKSDVYMNKSGMFAKKMLKKHGAQPEELLVVHDDSDITMGNFKLSFGRGAAGHHGIENVIKALGTKNFWRLRIGIRPKWPSTERKAKSSGADLPAEAHRAKAGEFVLKKITVDDKKILGEVFQRALREIIQKLTD